MTSYARGGDSSKKMKHPLYVPAVLILPLLWHLAAGRGVAAGSSSSVPPEPVLVWRFWSPVLGGHFYTLDEAEKEKLLTQSAPVWTYEGVAYRAFASGDEPNVAPVWRFWSGQLGSHFYTLDESERDKLLRDYPEVWTYEGIAFYAYPVGRRPAGTMPVYRFWSGVLGPHFYTVSDREQFTLSSSGDTWQYEGVAWYAYPPDSNAPVSLVKGPWLRQVDSRSATIMWETDVAADSRIDYGATQPGESSVCDPALVTRHKVVLWGLEPGTTYAYAATSGRAVSRNDSFTTAPASAQGFRFAVYGDSRSNPAVHAQVARNILDSAPALVFHTGDLVGRGTDYSLWQTDFFEPAQELLMSVPVVPVLGNHEYAGTGGVPNRDVSRLGARASWFYYFFDRPLDEGWWALTYGTVRFIGLDTNADYTPGSPQHTWLMQEFSSPEYGSAAWHIVIFHHPAFSSTTSHSDDLAVQRHLVPLFEQHQVDVVFQGHSHTYERYQHHGICYIVTAGGGAPLYPLRPDLTPPLRQVGLSVHHHCVVDVNPVTQTLILRAIDTTGHIFDTVALSR